MNYQQLLEALGVRLQLATELRARLVREAQPRGDMYISGDTARLAAVHAELSELASALGATARAAANDRSQRIT